MHSNIINQKEASNTGHEVHCHYHPDSDAWIAYGKSAYTLMQMMDNADIYTVGRYSVEHNMASIMVGRSALRRVCSLNDVAYTEGAKCITLSSPLPFDTSDYKTWSNYIKTSSRKKENRWVYTAVSYHLPEGEYIPDGMNFFTRNVKRLLDMIFSALAMVIFSPLFLITYIMVRMEDGGPAIFKQERVGRYGRTFNIYKFRSMTNECDENGELLHPSERITPFGRFIRRYSIDELGGLNDALKCLHQMIGKKKQES